MKKQQKSDTAIYRQYTDLSAMQIEQLKRMSSFFPFIADLAHAHLLLYIKTRDGDKYLVMKHHKPHTFFSQFELPAAGTMIAAVEEPLVSRVFEQGKAIHGRREWRLGNTLDMYAYPIKDGNDLIGVVTLETSQGYATSSSYYQLLEEESPGSAGHPTCENASYW